LLRARGAFVEAEKILRETVELRRKVLTSTHPDYATSLTNLGAVYTDLGDYLRAEQLFLEVVAIREKTVGTNHRRYGVAMNNLGEAYRGQGQYPKAEKALLMAREVLEKDRKDPKYLPNLNTIGYVYHVQGEYDKAEPFYRQALEAARTVFGEDHPAYCVHLTNLGVLCLNRNDLDQAQKLLEEASWVSSVPFMPPERGPWWPACGRSTTRPRRCSWRSSTRAYESRSWASSRPCTRLSSSSCATPTPSTGGARNSPRRRRNAV
jgi:tetratricopeptide (TPR) repeat protein